MFHLNYIDNDNRSRFYWIHTLDFFPCGKETGFGTKSIRVELDRHGRTWAYEVIWNKNSTSISTVFPLEVSKRNFNIIINTCPAIIISIKLKFLTFCTKQSNMALFLNSKYLFLNLPIMVWLNIYMLKGKFYFSIIIFCPQFPSLQFCKLDRIDKWVFSAVLPGL